MSDLTVKQLRKDLEGVVSPGTLKKAKKKSDLVELYEQYITSNSPSPAPTEQIGSPDNPLSPPKSEPSSPLRSEPSNPLSSEPSIPQKSDNNDDDVLPSEIQESPKLEPALSSQSNRDNLDDIGSDKVLSSRSNASIGKEPEPELELGEEDLYVSPLRKEKMRDSFKPPDAPIMPPSLNNMGLRYPRENEVKPVDDEEIDELTMSMDKMNLEDPTEPIDYSEHMEVFDIRNTNLNTQKRSSPFYKLLSSHMTQSEVNNFYAAVFLRPDINFKKYDIFASIDESKSSDGSLLSLAILGAPKNFEKSEGESFSLCNPSGDIFKRSPDFPDMIAEISEDLPAVSSKPMAKWVTMESPSAKVLESSLVNCLDVEPLEKKADDYIPCLFFHVHVENSVDEEMELDNKGECLLCTFDNKKLSFFRKNEYECEQLTADDLVSIYGSKFSFSILIYSSPTLPPGPFTLSGDMLFEDISVHMSQSTKVNKKRSLMSELTPAEAKKSKVGRSKKRPERSRKKPKGEPKKSIRKKPKQKRSVRKVRAPKVSALEFIFDNKYNS